MLSKKYLIGAMILLFLVVGLFSSVRMAKAQNVIKIGIFGPQSAGIAHWRAGMWSAAQMLVERWYPSGWDVGGTSYTIQVVAANEYTEAPSNTQGIKDEITRLCEDEQVDFIVGGFRTECVEVAIDHWHEQGYSDTIPFFINGAATNELIGNRTGYDHDSWKNLYRIMPTNSSALVGTFVTAVKTVLCSSAGILRTLFGKVLWEGGPAQVKTAVFVEDLKWANIMWNILTTPSVYPAYLGPYVNVSLTASKRLPDGITLPANYNDFKQAVDHANDEGCNLALIVFSGPAGVYIQKAVNELNASMLVLGIDVAAQEASAWAGGAIEYESTLMALGTRTPITPELERFWDDFVDWTSDNLHEALTPVYTAIGVGNAFITLKDAIENTDSLDADVLHDYLCPTTNPGRSLKVLNGMASFTPQHDIYQHPAGYDYSNYWTGNARSLVIQWLDARQEVVYPKYYLANASEIPWAKVWCLPPWMYTLIWDQNYNGYVGGDDITAVAKHFGARPGDSRWDHKSDINNNNYVGGDDITAVAKHFGARWTPPDP
jgi:hypothetical protein